MSTHLIGSTVLMALLVVTIFAGVSRIGQREKRDTAALPVKQADTPGGRVSRAADSPAGLGTIFLVLTLVLGATTLAAIGPASGMLPNAFAIVMGIVGLLLAGFLFLGTYAVVREYGLGAAHGVAAGLIGLGGAGILLVAANLVFDFI